MKKAITKRRVWTLGWNGMKKITIEINNFNADLLKVDDWFAPAVGELCVNHKGNIDVVTEIVRIPAKDPFKSYLLFSLKYSKDKVSERLINRIYVKKGKTFKFRGKTFKFQEPTES